MLSSTSTVLSALLALGSLASAQTSTKCNPLSATCPSDPGLTASTFSTDFTQGKADGWEIDGGTTLTYSDKGAAFTINTGTNAPTIQTAFYFLFGYVEVKMKAAPGTGIISSIVLESDDLDEVDWEFLGGQDSTVQTNFYGKGNTTTYDRMYAAPVSAATTTYHTYGMNWTADSLTWSIDGAVVRTLRYTDALALGGKNYPQTPSRLKLGSWAGGASTSPGTVTWAGGATNFAQAPFNMYVQSVKIVNYNPAKSYTYGDNSGAYQSIKIDGGSSGSSTVRGSLVNRPNAAVAAGTLSNTGSSVSASSSSVTSAAAAATTMVTSTMTSTGATTVTAAAASASSATTTAQSTNSAGRSFSVNSMALMALAVVAALAFSA